MKRILPAIALPFALSACSLQSLPYIADVMGDPKSKTMESATASGVKADPMRLDTIAFADAYCRRDGKAAVAATQKLVVAHPTHPRAKLLYGLSLDLPGRGVMAYRVIEPLTRANHSMPAVLRCGDEFIYSGTVTEVAQRRLFRVKTQLNELGLQFPLPDAKTHQAAGNAIYKLAAMAPVELPKAPMAKTSLPQPEKAISKKDDMTGTPSKPSAKCSRFVHLGSYKNTRTLEKGWRSLRKRYGGVLGNSPKAVSKVWLGKKKGQYLRLGVSAANLKTAQAICKKLKAGGQYCAVMRARKS
ncbi:MAG: hypothetical protein ACPGRZ_13685 [Alphaproteobacteria bacterium]